MVYASVAPAIVGGIIGAVVAWPGIGTAYGGAAAGGAIGAAVGGFAAQKIEDMVYGTDEQFYAQKRQQLLSSFGAMAS